MKEFFTFVAWFVLARRSLLWILDQRRLPYGFRCEECGLHVRSSNRDAIIKAKVLHNEPLVGSAAVNLSLDVIEDLVERWPAPSLTAHDARADHLASLVPALIVEVRKLREIVLRDHRPPATLNDFCMECSGEWPCSSARAAGAT